MKLPSGLRSFLAGLGIGRAYLDPMQRLMRSPDLAHVPPRLRQLLVRMMLRDHLAGRRIGSVVPGFYPYLAKTHPWPAFPDDVYAAGKAPPETLLPVLAPLHGAVPAMRLALHIHAYYLDGLPDILARITANQSRPDLFVTGPEAQRDAAAAILATYPGRSSYRAVANVGRDIVPFLQLLPELTSGDYDLIGHVHIKQSLTHSRSFVGLWSEYLLSGVLGGGTAVIDQIVQDAAARGPGAVIYFPHMATRVTWGGNRAQAREILQMFDLGTVPEDIVCSLGTMFWATPDHLARFAAIDLPWDRLTPEPLPADGTHLHAVERLFGALAMTKGGQIVITGAPRVPFVYCHKMLAKSLGEKFTP